jgi:hypothetical protein
MLPPNSPMATDGDEGEAHEHSPDDKECAICRRQREDKARQYDETDGKGGERSPP